MRPRNPATLHPADSDPPAFARAWRDSIEAELTGNILPWWLANAIDPATGGVVGGRTVDNAIVPGTPHTAILASRVMWTFARAYRRYGRAEHRRLAERILQYFDLALVDKHHGGVFWSVDDRWRPLDERKHTYAHAFAIFGLSELYRATEDEDALRIALEIFVLTETRLRDEANGGHIEARARNWSPADDSRLDSGAPRAAKSANTLLHVIEALANLLRARDDDAVRARLRECVGLFFDRALSPRSHHSRPFFEADWRPLKATEKDISFGHDIEASWLLVDAAEAIGDAALLNRSRELAVLIAGAVLKRGLEKAGALRDSPKARERQWWVQAEGVVGFYNAWQISGDARFLHASRRCWQTIESHFIDRNHGDWFKVLGLDWRPSPGALKAGPWHGSYHQARMGFEMVARLAT